MNLLLVLMSFSLLSGSADDRYLACFEFGSLVDGGSVEPHWLDGGGFWYVSVDGDTLRVDVASGTSMQYSPVADATEAGGNVVDVAVIGDDLWLVGADSVQITEDGDPDDLWYAGNAIWSPDRRFMALDRFGLSEAPLVLIVDWLDPLTPEHREPATQAREPRLQHRNFIVDTERAAVVEVADDGRFPEPESIAVGWTPGGDLLISRFDRPMRHQELVAVDPERGRSRVLIEEQRDTFIDGLAFLSLAEHYLTDAGDGEHFLWLSERDGYRHLYLYTWEGELVRRLTTGEFPVIAVHGVDADNGWVYFTAKPDLDDPTSQYPCRVSLRGGDIERLAADPGRRRVSFAPDWSCFVDNHSDLDRPPRADLRKSDGTLIAMLETADISALEDWEWQAPQRTTALAADGESTVFAAIWLPPGFDATKKYPVIEVIYAGPQWMIVPRRFVAGEYGDTAAALAQLGYVTVILDSPGTAGVGKAYQDAIYGKLGQIEIPDHVAAMKDLASTRPWMDLERVGVHGKSWGGYYTLRAMLQAPEFYKVGVASSVVADLATTGEAPVVPYLGLPSENPDGYAAADCLPMAGELEGDLLITIGTSDRNTPFGQTMRMLHAFEEADKDVEVLVFPGEHHWLQDKSFDRWKRGMRDFFVEHLPPGGP